MKVILIKECTMELEYKFKQNSNLKILISLKIKNQNSINFLYLNLEKKTLIFLIDSEFHNYIQDNGQKVKKTVLANCGNKMGSGTMDNFHLVLFMVLEHSFKQVSNLLLKKAFSQKALFKKLIDLFIIFFKLLKRFKKEGGDFTKIFQTIFTNNLLLNFQRALYQRIIL